MQIVAEQGIMIARPVSCIKDEYNTMVSESVLPAI